MSQDVDLPRYSFVLAPRDGEWIVMRYDRITRRYEDVARNLYTLAEAEAKIAELRADRVKDSSL